MKAMKLVVSIHQDEDGVFIVECPAIPGCVSQGQTEAEATENVKDAIRECLAARTELGMPLTVTTREVESGRLMAALVQLHPPQP